MIDKWAAIQTDHIKSGEDAKLKPSGELGVVCLLVP